MAYVEYKNAKRLCADFRSAVRRISGLSRAYDLGDDEMAAPLAAQVCSVFWTYGKTKGLLDALGVRPGVPISVPALDELFLGSGGLLSNSLCNLGTVTTGVGTGQTRYLPHFMVGPYRPCAPTLATIVDWLGEAVWRTSSGAELSRLDILKLARNKQGGAHYGLDLDPPAQAAEGHTERYRWRICGLNGETIGVSDRSASQVAAAVRQIAHEGLASLATTDLYDRDDARTLVVEIDKTGEETTLMVPDEYKIPPLDRVLSAMAAALERARR